VVGQQTSLRVIALTKCQYLQVEVSGGRMIFERLQPLSANRLVSGVCSLARHSSS
jgi:hypothetical protein